MNSNKFLLIGSSIMSLFAIAVTAVATAAWFNISNPGASLTSDSIVTTDADSNIEINNINAYKSVYDEIDANTKDYSSSHVVNYNVMGSKNRENINQGDITGFDIPEQGVGYYLLGDENWAQLVAGQDDTTAWKYASSLRMDDDVMDGANNYAMLTSVYLPEGAMFKVRHHYFSGSDIQDDWINGENGNLIDTNAYTTSALQQTGSNIEVKTGGYYNIYLLKSYRISVYPLGDLSGESRVVSPVSKSKAKISRTSGVVKSGSHIFVKVPSSWSAANAITVIYVWREWNNNNSNEKWYKMTSDGCNSGYLHSEVDANVNKFILIRYSSHSGTSGTGWPGNDNIWNRTYNIEFQIPDGHSAQYEGEVCDQLWEMGTSTAESGYYFNDLSCYLSEEKLTEAVTFTPGFYIIGNYGKIKHGSTTTTLSWNATGTIGGVRLTKKTGDNVAEEYDLEFILDNSNTPIEFRIKYCGPLTKWVDRKSTEYHGYYIDNDSKTCSDTTLVPVQTVNANIKITSNTKLDVYLNGSKHVYVYPRLTVEEYYKKSFKTYTSASYTTSYDSSWTLYKSTEINYNRSYTPTSSPSVSGTTWSGTWYKNEAMTTTWNSSTLLTEDASVYTSFRETEYTLKIRLAYTNTAGNSIDYYGGSDGNYAASKSTTATNGALNAMRNALGPDSRYTFKGYYKSTTLTDANKITSISANTVTSNFTVYAVYQPTEVVITEVATFWYKNSNNEFESLSDVFGNMTIDTVPGYKPIDFDTPASPGNIYKTLQTARTIKSHDCEQGLYKFTFDDWYTDSSCSTKYSTLSDKKPTGNKSIYARVYITFENQIELYADASDSYWWESTTPPTNCSISLYHPETGAQFALTNKPFPNGSIFKFSAPNNDTESKGVFRLIRTGDNPATAWYQTIDVETGLHGSDPSGGMHDGGARGECTLISIWHNQAGYIRYQEGDKWLSGFSWGNFYGTTTEGNGYYLVGKKSFTGSTALEWSFEAARKMSDGTNHPLPRGLDGDCIAYYDNITLSQGMEFKIWEYSTLTGRVSQYNDLNSDPDTTGMALVNNDTNIEIKEGVVGDKFSIYLIRVNSVMKIVIYDNDQKTYIFFNEAPESYDGQTAFKMGYGDHTTAQNPANKMICETGIRITQEDVDNNVSFAIRDRRAGTTTWYDDDNAADHDLIAKGVISADNNYGDENDRSNTKYLPAGEYGIRFRDPGYYKFYLTSSGQIVVNQLPGDYGEGYYVVPYNSSVGSTAEYTNGIKMKTISTTGTQNKAVYTCYTAKDNLSFYIKAYLSGVEHHAAGVNVFSKTLTNTDNATIDSRGVVTLKQAGSYNIYITTANEIAITTYTAENFFSLNSINNSLTTQGQIKDAQTSIVLEVDFTTTTSFNAEAIAELVATSSGGAASYIDFTYSVVPFNYDFGNYDNPYNYMRSENYIGEGHNTGAQHPTNLVSGQYKMMILIDYKASMLPSLPAGGTTNNFYFILKMRQTA